MAKKVWQARFKKKLHPEAEKFTESVSFDKRLASYDIKGSIAHTQMLAHTGIIKSSIAKKIIKGLKNIGQKKIKFSTAIEDVHMNIENALAKKIGTASQYLHTGRSRNDQVQLDMRMYVKDEINTIIYYLKILQKCLLEQAEKNIDIIIPGFTHMRHAQPVLLAHHLLAYINMFERDKDRMEELFKRVDIMPLGSSALAGSGLPLDRNYTAKLLGFSKVSSNSMDSVSDRDYLIELASGLAIAGMHLSRLAEELVIWSTKEFEYIDIDESLCTGSSLMPQKKNPDTAELLRAKTGRLNGNLICLLTVLKGLPLTYNRDMQEDKPPVFDSIDTIKGSLKIASLLIKKVKINKSRIKEIVDSDTTYLAVDMVDSLVLKGKPFRKAYQDIGRVVREKNKLDTKLNAKASITAKKTYGSTNPRMVKQAVKKWKRKIWEK